MEDKKPTGAIISVIIIVLVLAFGAYYFLKQVPVPAETSETITPTEVPLDTTTSALSKQGTSTEIADIQKDLNATDFSNVGTGLSDIAI